MSEENKSPPRKEEVEVATSLPYQTIGLGFAAAAAALWGYTRFFGSASVAATPAVATAAEAEPKKNTSVLSACALKHITERHPMYQNLQEIQTRIYDTDKLQLKQFAEAAKMLDAFEGLMVNCPNKKHTETMSYPETAFNIQREFMHKIKMIAQAQRKDDTHVRANVVMEFAELINDWMTGNIGNLNLMNDEKVAMSIIGA